MTRQTCVELLQSQPAILGNRSNLIIRKYLHPSDQTHVVEMCKNVYNGSDYMPRMIQHYAERPGTAVLVSQPDNQEGNINGMVVGHKRGSAWFLSGLRVHEDARGKGVARTLMEHICKASAEYGNIQAITSTTIPQNPAAVRIFEALGFTHTHTVDVWPAYAALTNYEQAIGFVPCSQPEPQQQHSNMLDHIPGVRGVISQATRSLGVRVDDWVQCSSQQELQQAVASIRLQQVEQPGMQQLLPELPVNWLPWVYEAWPLDSPWIKERIAEGEVWLLPQSVAHCRSSSSACGSSSAADSSAQTGSCGSLVSSPSCGHICLSSSGSSGGLDSAGGSQLQCHAVVVVARSAENRRRCAGILTAGDAFVPAAIELVGSHVPHFVCFCDRGSQHSSGKPDPDVVLPDLFTMTGANSCFSVYARPFGTLASTGGCSMSMHARAHL